MTQSPNMMVLGDCGKVFVELFFEDFDTGLMQQGESPGMTISPAA
jgi:hypothetical protein